MNFSTAFLDELRSRASIVRVAGRKVVWDLKKSNQGKGDMWAPCPFHQEKTASFHVDDQKGYYYCFGCHAKGDSIGFIKETENLTFVEAVESLAQECGMELPRPDPQYKKKNDKRLELINVMELATEIYKQQLRSDKGAEARKYLSSRGTSDDSCSKFEIGFTLESSKSLFKKLKERGISSELIIQAGLSVQPDNGGEPFDRFRDRIIFPIRNIRGQCIAFGGRAMSQNAKAKYLNSPETELFNKSNTLYNFKAAREAMKRDTPLLVVEGYMDVIALDAHGFSTAVAPLGTAVTNAQLSLLWQISAEPIVALDGDSAGDRAADRLIDLALPNLEANKSLRFCILPEGQDPDDVLKISGVSRMKELIENSIPLINLLWKRETEGKVFDSPERRVALDKSLRDIIRLIKDKDLRTHYGKEFAALRSKLFYNTDNTASYKFTNKNYSQNNNTGLSFSNTKRSMIVASDDMEIRLRESLLLAVVIRYPRFISEFLNDLEALELKLLDNQNILTAILLSFPLSEDQNLELMLSEKLGANKISNLFDLKYLKIAPALQSNSSDEKIRQTIIAELTKIKARQGVEREVQEALEDLQGDPDEGITWRVSKAAEANNAANRIQQDETSDELENQKILSNNLQSLIDNQVWKKKKTN